MRKSLRSSLRLAGARTVTRKSTSCSKLTSVLVSKRSSRLPLRLASMPLKTTPIQSGAADITPASNFSQHNLTHSAIGKCSSIQRASRPDRARNPFPADSCRVLDEMVGGHAPDTVLEPDNRLSSRRRKRLEDDLVLSRRCNGRPDRGGAHQATRWSAFIAGSRVSSELSGQPRPRMQPLPGHVRSRGAHPSFARGSDRNGVLFGSCSRMVGSRWLHHTGSPPARQRQRCPQSLKLYVSTTSSARRSTPSSNWQTGQRISPHHDTARP